MDDVFVAYLRAKLAAEEDLLARSGLATTVLRPGSLTDDPGTGRVTLARHVESGSIPRDDVAAVLLALLDAAGGRRSSRWSAVTPRSTRPSGSGQARRARVTSARAARSSSGG